MKKIKYTQYIPSRLDVPENQILRVPPNRKSFQTAYEMIKAAAEVYPVEDFDDFYAHTDTIYMVQNTERYIAAGWIGHKLGDKNIPYKFRGLDIYLIRIALFFCELEYSILFDLVKTLIKDKNDRIIYVENIHRDDEHKNIINAFVNNKFKWLDDKTLYHLPDVIEGMNKEELLQVVNPEKMEDKVVDRYAMLECPCPDVAGAQERYMRDLKAKAYEDSITTTTAGCCDANCECGCNDPLDTGCSWDEFDTSCCCE